MITKCVTIGGFCLLVAAPVIGAHAQLAGTYNGTQANGATISLTVTQKNTKVELSGLGVGITTTCPDGEAIDEDTGIGFEPVPIPKPKSVSGMITSYVPALSKFTKHPRKSETCISAQSFTASLGGRAQTSGRKPKLVIY
jgi:hypothetical protein